MASTGKQNGTLISLYIDGTAIGHCTAHNFSITMETRDTTDKGSAGWSESGEGLRSAEFSVEGWFAEDGTVNFSDLFANVNSRTSVTALWSSGVTGDKTYSATAWLTNIELGAPLEETMPFSATLTVTGAVTEATVA